MSVIVGIFMSDSKNNDDNARYKEGYNEGRSGSFDPLLKVVEGLFFGGDQIKDAGAELAEMTVIGTMAGQNRDQPPPPNTAPQLALPNQI